MKPAPPNPANSPMPGGQTLQWLAGGEMARLIESFDWPRSPLGPVAQWPQSLKTALNICLGSRFQLAIYWGPEHVFLYNDAEREVIGALHPGALGKPAREVLVDMWDTVRPMLTRVLEEGEATWSVDQPLMIDRFGLVEEAFFTWSYSPIPDDAGGIGGVLLVTEETTQRVFAERRLRTLKEMAAETAAAMTTEQVCEMTMRILGQNPADIPFALLYLLDATGSVRLRSSTGCASPTAQPFPFEKVTRHKEVVQIDNLACFFDAEVARQLPESALILPILEPDLENIAGFLVAGVSEHQRLDKDYRNFFDLVAAQIEATLASANAREQERIRSQAIAELDRAKTAFFTNVSHEFRTPLSVILGVVDDLLAKTDHALRDSNREELSAVRRNSLRLLKLVNTILAFSKVEAGSIRAVYEPTDLAAFTAELASGFRSTMEKAGLTFHVAAETLPEPVYVDPDMWEKIVLNLLSNAFKFTLQGEVSVTVKCVENAAQLVVKDTGIGIQEKELPRIFERFRRAEGARGRTQEGTGIGLALVRELVTLHGGSIRAESVLGQGTRFVVAIPLGMKHLPPDRVLADPTPVSGAVAASAYAEEARRWLPGSEDDDKSSETEESSEQSYGDRSFVLVADDNADMRDYFRSLLRGRYTVKTVSDGEQALLAIHTQKPDLVLADVMMPKLDGFGLLRRLRADPETQSIPVIMISARAGEEEKIEGMKQGADDYLVKPFSFRELLARVHSHIELARLRQETTERERKLRVEADSQRALLEAVLNGMPAGLVIAQAPSGAVVLANRQAEDILQRPVQSLRRIEEYSEYQLFRLTGRQYDTDDQPLARSILRGEVVIGEELNYLRPDGAFRVLLANSAPVRDAAGTIVAGVVAFQDITDLRMAQDELLRQSNDVIHELAGRLINAQEEERKRIARDLHDDFSQRLALHCVDLDLLCQSLPAGSDTTAELGRLQSDAYELAHDLRQISHNLHHPQMALGLKHGAASFCREFSEQHGIAIELTHEGDLKQISEAVSIVLFRVLQEALSNVAKHSGANRATVFFSVGGEQALLRVADRGRGFATQGLQSDGLGLISMRERLRLVRGTISIISCPGQGTVIESVVPIPIPDRPASEVA